MKDERIRSSVDQSFSDHASIALWRLYRVSPSKYISNHSYVAAIPSRTVISDCQPIARFSLRVSET